MDEHDEEAADPRLHAARSRLVRARALLFILLLPELMLALPYGTQSQAMSGDPKEPHHREDMPVPTVNASATGGVQADASAVAAWDAPLLALWNIDLWCWVLLSHLLWRMLRSPIHAIAHVREVARRSAASSTFGAAAAHILSADVLGVSLVLSIAAAWRVLSVAWLHLAGLAGGATLSIPQLLHPAVRLRLVASVHVGSIPGTAISPFWIIDVAVPAWEYATALACQHLFRVGVVAVRTQTERHEYPHTTVVREARYPSFSDSSDE